MEVELNGSRRLNGSSGTKMAQGADAKQMAVPVTVQGEGLGWRHSHVRDRSLVLRGTIPFEQQHSGDFVGCWRVPVLVSITGMRWVGFG